MARGFCFSPVACLISFASSKETGKARSPRSGRGGTSAASCCTSTPKSSRAALRMRSLSFCCSSNRVMRQKARVYFIRRKKAQKAQNHSSVWAFLWVKIDLIPSKRTHYLENEDSLLRLFRRCERRHDTRRLGGGGRRSELPAR